MASDWASLSLSLGQGLRTGLGFGLSAGMGLGTDGLHHGQWTGLQTASQTELQTVPQHGRSHGLGAMDFIRFAELQYVLGWIVTPVYPPISLYIRAHPRVSSYILTCP